MQFLKQRIDRWAISAAARISKREPANPAQAEEVARQLQRPDLFNPPGTIPQITIRPDQSFQFASAVQTSATRSNTVHGKFFPAGATWRERPSVVLVHGWNAEMHYQKVLPSVAKRINRRGMNAVLMELPYHMHRRPSNGHPVTDFISNHIPTMLEATAQAIADLNGLMHWLKSHGGPVGVWGFSLGAWLTGLHVCHSPVQDAAVLMTPVSNLERAIQELEFCHPIRAALEVVPVDLRRLNLHSLRPQVASDRILLVEGAYDMFVPGETYRELAQAWDIPHWSKVAQSHISILVSRAVMRQTVDWLALRLGSK